MYRSERSAMKDRINPGHVSQKALAEENTISSLTGQGDGKQFQELQGTSSKTRLYRNGDIKDINYVDRPLVRSKGPPISSPQRKLVLHFDIRNTILVADSVTKVNVEQALNSFLTSVTWGRVDRSSGKWTWHSATPCLTPPAPHTVTYYKHLERQLVQTPEDRQKLRFTTADFTQKGLGKMFLPYFEKHMRLLRWRYTRDEETLNRLTMKGKDQALYHYILPSFFKLMYHLKKSGRDFAIIFRTYGLDAKNVLRSTEYTINGNHPQFPESLDMTVNTVPGTIYRSAKNDVILRVCTKSSDPSSFTTYRNERDIYDTLSKMGGVCGFKDDFLHWQNHGYHYTSGKPLWVDPTDESVHHIIFDDNMRTYEDDNIVDLRIFGGHHVSSVPKAEVRKYEDVFMVQSDLMASIEHEDYFINKVRLCEENYSKLLKDGIVRPPHSSTLCM
ncbi:uncharacterized protein LOC135471522 [Liolophura sinensis]|uniref:uncharacterized protein LOC135471522 n=1 Tax=Liolophura sinensis TaxID=3198878 RepID=UPI003158E564